MEYPSYFRKNGRCVKVLSPTQAVVILLPPDANQAERFTSTFPDPSRLMERIQGMAAVDESKWNEFESTFRRKVKAELDELTSTSF